MVIDDFNERCVMRTKTFEGFRGHPYDDGKGGVKIGFGTPLPLDEEDALLLVRTAQRKMVEAIRCSSRGNVYDTLPDNAKMGLIDLMCISGSQFVLQLIDTWNALIEHDFDVAADSARASFMDSFPHLSRRIEDNANLIRSCHDGGEEAW